MSDVTIDTKAEGQPHPYHLVDPSPWPLFGAFSALFLALGVIVWMHGYGFAQGSLKPLTAADMAALGEDARLFIPGWMAVLPGLFAVLLCMLVWWRDVIDEAVTQKAHSRIAKIGFRYGMIFFITSEVMFFFAFFWAFFDASIVPSLAGQWPPEGIKTFDPWHLPFTMTLVLLLSGTTVTWAHHALLEGNRKDATTGLALTVLLGIIFTCLQAYEYGHAAFSISDTVYGSAFYMATGFHGFHVIIGTIFLSVCLFRNIKGHFTPTDHFGFEAAAWYWHFVDVVWLFLFVSIYWWGS